MKVLLERPVQPLYPLELYCDDRTFGDNANKVTAFDCRKMTGDTPLMLMHQVSSQKEEQHLLLYRH